jgi:hypothetical protein
VLDDASDELTVWFDVDDLLHHFKRWPTVTGIQRVTREIIREALTLRPEDVGLVKIARLAGEFQPISRVADYLSQQLSLPESQAMPAGTIKRGDIVVELGASWPRWHFARAARNARRRSLRLGVMIHDLLPATHPHLFDRRHARSFVHAFERIANSIDIFFVSSDHVAEQIDRYFRNWNRPPPHVERLPFGAGFSVSSSYAPVEPWPEPYVLLVSTLEIRKNHILMLRLWQHLIAKHGREAIPSLVFVGREGWLVDELMGELKRTRFLSGKIVWHVGLDDAGLAAAYEHCLFTVYPSMGEGWGLPVTESLKHGKLCISSDKSALVEAGGRFADYFNPDDFDDACRKVERALFDRAYLARRSADIAGGFVAASWADTARHLLGTLERMG